MTFVEEGETKTATLNQGTWALAAGFSRKLLYTQMDRMRLDPNRTLVATTVVALAAVAKVSAHWLLDGKGDPDDIEQPAVMRDERYEAMPFVRDLAVADGIDRAFVEQWEALLDSDDQPSPGELFDLVRQAWKSHVRKTAAKGDPLTGLDERTVRTARKKT